MHTLVELLSRSAERWGNLPALLMHGNNPWSWSYAELWDAAQRTAAYLRDRGVARGDRIILWAGSRPEWVAAFFGIQVAGAIAVPLDVRSSEDLFIRIEQQTQPKHIFFGAEQAKSIRGSQVPSTPLEELRERLRGVAPLTVGAGQIAPDDIAELVFTSGTTGNPKGVILTHRNIVSNVEMAATVIQPTTGHRVLSILPLSHMLEQTAGLFVPLLGGASVTYISSLRPDVIFGAMAANHITNMGCVPQVLQLFRDGIEREVRKQGKLKQFEQLHAVARRLPMAVRSLLFRRVHQRMGGAFGFFVVGGAFLDPALARWWEGLGIKVVQGYGMTEASPVVAMHSLSKRDHTSVGYVLPGCEVKIAEDGEILVRGPHVTRGYWQNPAATAQAFSDGWYHTGDLGFFDAAGGLHLHGRKKNMIALANGMKVYPEDVERALVLDPEVKDVVVLGLARGQDVEVHAVLLLEKDAGDAPAIVKRANTRLAPHQQIRGHTIWPDETFPLTPTLKVKRGEVARRLAWIEPEYAVA